MLTTSERVLGRYAQDSSLTHAYVIDTRTQNCMLASYRYTFDPMRRSKNESERIAAYR